ncbi:MAG: response regulator, partial [Rhabdochlamydiaceae bacterium]
MARIIDVEAFALLDIERTHRGGSVNIALLEDNPPILDYLSTALEMLGHTVYKFTSSAPLLESLFIDESVRLPLPYDLALIDLLLPGSVSGLQTAQKIQQAIPSQQLHIIVLSACSQAELEEAQAALPQVPILRKPFKIHELAQLIDQMQ